MRISILAVIASCVLGAAMAMADGTRFEQRLAQAVAADQLPGLHSVLVLRHGEVFAEAYFKGRDERWGRPLGERQHGPDEIHDLRSVTKSVVGLLYGIALADGLVPAPEAPLYAQFPEYAGLADDPDRQAVRVMDALNMTMGLRWNEDLPYSDPRNSEIAMERAPDRFRYVLDSRSRPLPVHAGPTAVGQLPWSEG